MQYLSKNALTEALADLSAELGSADGIHELIIAGGAAIVLLYGARESTKDIDAVSSECYSPGCTPGRRTTEPARGMAQ